MLRQRRTRWFGLLLGLTLILAVLPVSAAAQPGARSQRTFTIISVNRVPILDITAVGALVARVEGEPSSFSISWSYHGVANGAPASASGSGVGSWDEGSETASITLTGIDSWNISGFAQPSLPKSATIDSVGFGSALVDVSDPNQGSIVSNVPVRVLPPIGNPFHGRSFYVASSFGTGSTNIGSLPGAQTRYGGSFPRF
jgi:hypothetical protein